MQLKISERAELLPASPIRKLVPYANAAKAKGVNVFHLNIGQPDIDTPPAIMDTLKNLDMPVLAYGDSAGNSSYRQKLVGYYQSVGIHVAVEDIMITTGGSEALYFAFMACFNPGDEVIIPEPFYANYNSFALQAGVKVIPISADIKDGFKLPPMEDFEKVISEKTKGIVLCNPNNPTGYLYSREELEVLKGLVAKYNLFLLSDEAYREFCYEGEHFSAMQLEGIEQNVVLLDTISKRYSACGARIGMFVSRNKALMQAVLKFGQARLCSPVIEQLLGEAALDLPSDYFDEVKAEYLRRRDTLVAGLQSIEGVVCSTPGGAFYVMAELPVDDADVFCQWILEKFTYNNSTVMMAPGSGFYANGELGKKQVRLAYVLNNEDIENSILCLKSAILEYNKK